MFIASIILTATTIMIVLNLFFGKTYQLPFFGKALVQNVLPLLKCSDFLKSRILLSMAIATIVTSIEEIVIPLFLKSRAAHLYPFYILEMLFVKCMNRLNASISCKLYYPRINKIHILSSVKF